MHACLCSSPLVPGAGEGEVEGGAAAQGQPTGRHSAGVLLLRLTEHLWPGLCASEEREQRGVAVPGPPCQRLRHQGAQPGPHSVAAPHRRQGFHALAGQAALTEGIPAAPEVRMRTSRICIACIVMQYFPLKSCCYVIYLVRASWPCCG